MKASHWFLLLGLLCAGAMAQDDPFAILGVGISKEAAKKARKTKVDLVYEVFSLPIEKAAALLRAGQSDQELYGKLINEADANGVEQEVFQSIASRSGEEVVLSDGNEIIYPTEWEMAFGVENPPTLKIYDEMWVPPLPTAFETKRLGQQMTLLPTSDLEAGIVTVKYIIWEDSLSSFYEWSKGEEAHRMPRFASSEIKSELVIPSGEVRLLGTMNHGDFKERKERTRLAFLRATIDGVTEKVPVDWAWQTRYEVFSLPAALAARLRREVKGGDLYGALLDEKHSANRTLEWVMAVTGFPRRTMMIEHVCELIYPTEYNPAGFHFEKVPKAQNWRRNSRLFPRFPHAFETKSVGEYLELEFYSGEGVVDLRLNSTLVEYPGKRSIGKGNGEWQMPEFLVSAVKTGLTVKPGKATLVGTANSAGQDDRVRWVFLTMSMVK